MRFSKGRLGTRLGHRLGLVSAVSLGVSWGAITPAISAVLEASSYTNGLQPSQTPAAAGSKCLAFVSRNLAKGLGNFFTYVQLVTDHQAIRPGDVFEYEIWLDPANPSAKGGLDITFDNILALREHHIPDQNGIDSHGDGILTPAIGKWYTRRIPLDFAAGHQTDSFDLVFEGDEFGQFTQFIDNVKIVHADGSSTTIFPTSKPTDFHVLDSNGYTNKPSVALIDRSEVGVQPIATVIKEVDAQASRRRQLADLSASAKLAQALLSQSPDPATEKSLAALNATLAALDAHVGAPDSAFNSLLAIANGQLKQLTPFTHQTTAFAVGHAHIDVQWLWESQESLQAAYDTWNQATKFMAAYPDFKFTQSSAGYYREVQTAFPELFAKIKKFVKNGQWEIVGGRECEADENLISPEAHARHFLYAQRYFRQTFGKTAVVGWEPDTFGHTAQMPQILSLGGCKYYYFCRGGKGKPLFQWQALDGTSVPAFDQVASGAWYNTPLTNNVLAEIPPFEKATGKHEIMWVYGVGNHGGGPSKEHIEQAKTWQKSPGLPTVKFSTAEAFFKAMLADKGTGPLPVIKSDLEGVFRGCYTTNAEVKRLNRFAEADMVSAEAVASVAHYLTGFPYPSDEFAKDWEKITFNQHHDTICGSSFHFAYLQTIPDFNHVIADAKDIERDALVRLSVGVKAPTDGTNFLVFNPTGWARSGWVDVRTPSHLLGGGDDDTYKHPVAVGPDGKEHPIEITDPVTHAGRFYATAVPGFGYRVYTIQEGKTDFAPITVGLAGLRVENDKMVVTFDPKRGCVGEIKMKEGGPRGSELVFSGKDGIGALESHLEKPSVEAWDLNQIVKVDNLTADSSTPISGPGFAGITFTYHLPSDPATKITQTFRLNAGSDQVDVTCDVDWQVVSTPKEASPLLRLAIDPNLARPTATYQVPFGAVSRPLDGGEVPAQAWADISGPRGGITIIEDSKHGFSAVGTTLRMSIIRGNYEPDMLPNRGIQALRYSLVPHAGNWQRSDGARRAMELENSLLSINVPPDAKGPAPLEYSFAEVMSPDVLPIALKKAEDGEGYVVRMYETTGKSITSLMKLPSLAQKASLVNFVEDPIGVASIEVGGLPLALRPWQITSVSFIPATNKLTR